MLGDYLVYDITSCLEKFGKFGIPKNGGNLDVLPCHTSVTLCIIQSEWLKKCEDSTFLELKSFFYNPLKSSLKMNLIADHLGREIWYILYTVMVVKFSPQNRIIKKGK